MTADLAGELVDGRGEAGTGSGRRLQEWQPTSQPRPAAERGLPLPEVLSATGHARASLRLVMAYYDLGMSRQGEIARLVAGIVRGPARVGALARTR